MKILNGGCRVYEAQDGSVSQSGTFTARSIMSKASGAKQITQAVNDYAPGVSPAAVNPTSEEVLYVASGEGVCRINGFAYAIRPGAAIFIPPGAHYHFEAATPVRVIAACCPEDSQRKLFDPPVENAAGVAPHLTVHQDDREQIRAGADRIFRYLVHTDLGCKHVTQFVGWIPRSKAPFHLHTYEEGIFILEGRGILHLEGQMSASEFGPGTSIYLPDGVVHCLENPWDEPIRLLGVFHPSGSPGAAYEDN
ncbi:MAG TPA: cupin domain-containing protein [Bryobacteraceae bacterium]|nr:cupin domain-containing protein [Bryobacteraceae bacterium]